MLTPFYQELMIRDILGYTHNDIEDLELNEYVAILNYSWVTYNLRRPDLVWTQGKKGDGTTHTTSHPGLESSEQEMLRKYLHQSVVPTPKPQKLKKLNIMK